MKKIFAILSLVGLLLPSLSFATTITLYPASGANYPVDGWADYLANPNPPTFTNNTWAAVWGGGGTGGSDPGTNLIAGYDGFTPGGVWYGNHAWRSAVLFGFTTSDIPASSTINSAVLNLYEDNSQLNCNLITSAQEGLRLTSAPVASQSSLVGGDFANLAGQTAVYATDLDANSFATSTYNSMSLNAAGISYLQSLVGLTTSTIEFGLNLAADADNSTPTGENCSARWSFKAADTGASTTPYLVIDYTAGSGGGGGGSSSSTIAFQTWLDNTEPVIIGTFSTVIALALMIAIGIIGVAVVKKFKPKSRYDTFN